MAIATDRSALRDRRGGITWIVLSAIAFSSAGLFTKGVSADGWAVVFWRGAFAALVIVLVMMWRGGLWRELRHLGVPGWSAAIIGASGMAAFLHAFKLTTIANVALIYAAAPFLAAAIAWLWFAERPSRPTLVASCVGFCGVAIIVGGSIGGLSLSGDLLALWMAFVMALLIVIFRRYPTTSPGAVTAVSSILLLPVALIAGDPLAAPVAEIPIMAAFGFVFAFAAVALVEGARRLPASEASLLSTLEIPLAPIWALMLFGEVPAPATLIGGLVIFLAVLGSQIALSRRSGKPI